jgi:hypothetical protein
VYKYYYAGPASWKWFFPHYYAPLACDLVDLVALGPFVFDLGAPYVHCYLLNVFFNLFDILFSVFFVGVKFFVHIIVGFCFLFLCVCEWS